MSAVYKAIAAVTADMARNGIAKDRRNTQQGYNFRGIDDVYNALAPSLSKHGLCLLARVIRREVTERQTAKGGVLFYVVCDVEFDFVSAEDGSKHTVAVIGEAMDSGDKATNKAMSAAYKYAALMTFCIPTEGDHDAEGQSHEVSGLSAEGRKWLQAIDDAADLSTLSDIGSELAKSTMPAGDRGLLREEFAKRRASLSKGAE